MTESVDNTDESMLYYAKMAENLGEIASTSKVYVDMDGVLADFFGEWQKLIGSDWRKVKDIEPALQKIRDKDNFWLDLPLLPQAKNLLGIIKKVKGSYTILSSPLPNDPNSEPQKRAWIRKHLGMFPPAKIIIDHNKAAYAKQADGTPNALIDDFGENISKWRSAGGVGIQHKDIEVGDTISKLAQELEDGQEPVNEATEMKISDLTISDAGMAIAQSVGGGSRTDAPLAVTKLPLGYVYLVNGYHRLVDAMQAGKDTVSVEYVPYEKVEILWKQEREQDIKYGKQFNENFADGKVKGKSRPGRVKKSGASCNGSVTELRAKAKKASGEKAKMYHWCANMKSGKKK